MCLDKLITPGQVRRRGGLKPKAFREFNEDLSRRDIPIIARRFNAGIVVD